MYKGRDVIAIVTAGGRGTRMGVDIPKQFLDLGGEKIIVKTLKAFLSCRLIDRVIVTVPEDYADSFTPGPDVEVVPGGKERQDSVYNALKHINPGDEDIILIHDGVRPYVDEGLITRVIDAACQNGAAYPGILTVDTVRHAEMGTLDRDKVYRVQTPQGFKGDIIMRGFAKAKEDDFSGTDDISLVERIGIKSVVVEGSERNIKITTPEDLNMVDDNMRIGMGFDVHAFGIMDSDSSDKGELEDDVVGEKNRGTLSQKVRPLTLGGVKIPFDKGLIGHSDADVLTHGVMDALLGAAALPDIGRLFPDDDPEFDGISSIELLNRVYDKITEAGYQVVNVDATVMCQAPKLAPYIDDMRANLAEAIGIDISNVGLKATTTEGLGFAGRGEGIAVNVIALIKSI